MAQGEQQDADALVEQQMLEALAAEEVEESVLEQVSEDTTEPEERVLTQKEIDELLRKKSVLEKELQTLTETTDRHETWIRSLNKEVGKAGRMAQGAMAKAETVDEAAANAFSLANRAEKMADNANVTAVSATGVAETAQSTADEAAGSAMVAQETADKAITRTRGRWISWLSLVIAIGAIVMAFVISGSQGPKGPEGPRGYNGADGENGTSVDTQQLLTALHSALTEDTPLRSDVVELLREVVAEQLKVTAVPPTQDGTTDQQGESERLAPPQPSAPKPEKSLFDQL